MAGPHLGGQIEYLQAHTQDAEIVRLCRVMHEVFSMLRVSFAVFATPALALDDEGTVDSGRYVSGQGPSYTVPAPLHANRGPRLIEGRNAAVFGHFGTFNNAPSGRDAMVQSLGN
jgi:hypothetical protein